MANIRSRLLRGIRFSDSEAVQIQANLESQEAVMDVQAAEALRDEAYQRLYESLEEGEIAYLPDAPVRYQRWEGEVYVSSTAPGSIWQSRWIAPIVNRKPDRS